MWKVGTVVVIGCGCVAVVEWRVPRTLSLFAVRIARHICAASGHRPRMRILAACDSTRQTSLHH